MTPQQHLIAEERCDSIHIGALSSLSYHALRELCDAAGWPCECYMEPELVLLLIERLKRCKDNETVFPRGKWATVQALQHIFEKGFWK